MIIIIIIIISIINESYIMTCTVSFAPAATGLTGTGDTTTVWNLITLQHTEGRRRIMMKRKMDPLSLQHVQTTAVIRPAVTCSDILVQLIVFLVVISRSSKGKSLLLCSVYFQLLKKIWLKSRSEAIIFTLSRMLQGQQARNTQQLFSHVTVAQKSLPRDRISGGHVGCNK